MPKLKYCIACPRAGKSTYCSTWVNEEPKRVIVCSDDIRLALHGQRYEPLAETMVFAVKHIMIRSLLARGFDVIVDGTHSTEISIKRLLEIDENAEAVIFDTTPEECKRRAEATGQSDLGPVIDRIHRNMTKLGIYDNAFSSTIDRIKTEINNRRLYTKTTSNRST